MIEPDGPFLAMFAEAWEPLLGPGVDAEAFRETFTRGGHYTAPLPGLEGHRLIVLNSVFFSVNYDNACGRSTQTPALEQLGWLAGTLDRARAAGESVWLLMHVPPGINSFNSAEAVAKGGPPVTFWQPELTARFLQLVRRHRSTIRVAFAGHTHMDDFRVIRLDGEPVLPVQDRPGDQPDLRQQPGLSGLPVRPPDRAGRGYQTYFLTDLADAGRPASTRPPAAGPSSTTSAAAYGPPALDAARSPGWRTRHRDRPGRPGALREVLQRGADPGDRRPGSRRVPMRHRKRHTGRVPLVLPGSSEAQATAAVSGPRGDRRIGPDEIAGGPRPIVPHPTRSREVATRDLGGSAWSTKQFASRGGSRIPGGPRTMVPRPSRQEDGSMRRRASIGRWQPASSDSSPGPPLGPRSRRYHKDVTPILQKNCQDCHRPGQVAPFSLLTYEQARKRAGDLAHVTAERIMPPWPASTTVGGPFRDAAGAARRGDRHPAGLGRGRRAPRATRATRPRPASSPRDWPLGEPDLVLTMPEPYALAAEGDDEFRVFVLPTDFPEDRWIRAVDFRPGNRKVVHHVIAGHRRLGPGPRAGRARTPGRATRRSAGSATASTREVPADLDPGQPARGTPPRGPATSCRRGADVLIQVHYHKSGKPETDATSIGLYLSDEPLAEAGPHRVRLPRGPADPGGQGRWRRPRPMAGRASGPAWTSMLTRRAGHPRRRAELRGQGRTPRPA